MLLFFPQPKRVVSSLRNVIQKIKVTENKVIHELEYGVTYYLYPYVGLNTPMLTSTGDKIFVYPNIKLENGTYWLIPAYLTGEQLLDSNFVIDKLIEYDCKIQENRRKSNNSNFCS